MPNSNYRLILLSLLFLPCIVTAQTQKQLAEYLIELEEKHAVNFNYLNEDLKFLELTSPGNTEDLKQAIRKISFQLPVSFEFLDVENIIVRRTVQYYCIKIIGQNSNLPLSGVYIEAEHKILGKTYDNGSMFLSQRPESVTLKFFKKDYAIAEIDVDELQENDCKILTLIPQINLDEVVLAGYLTRGLDLNPDLSLTLNPQEFEILPGLTQADVLQSMQLIPGVVSLDERISNINVRGGTHDQNLFLWNGARLYQTGHFFGMISALNPSIAHEVNIYKNGSSAFYTEGLSSVVDISSTRNYEGDKAFEVFANFLEATARADLKLSDDSQLRVAGRYGLSGFVDTPSFQNYYNKIFQNTEITSLANNENVRLSSEVDLNYFDTNLQFETALNENTNWQINLLAISNDLQFSEQNLNTLEQQNNQLRQESYIATTRIDKTFSENLSASATAYASYYNLDAENALILANQQLSQQNEIQDYGVKLRSDVNFTKNSILSIGYQFNEIGVRNDNLVTNPDVVIRQKSVLQTHSGIAEWQSELFEEKLLSTIGLRLNYYDKFSELRLEPHFNLTYKWSPFSSTTFMAEQKHQVTAQVIDLQNDFFGIENRRWFLADQSQIPIQRLRQAEIGQVFTKKSWLLQANLFYKTVEGISSSAQNFQNQLEFLQLSGNYNTYGLELFVQKKVSDLRLWFNYAYNASDYEFNALVPAVFPNNFETSHHFQSGISYVAEPLKLSLSGRYFTGRPTTLIDEGNPILNAAINPEINFLNPNADNISAYSQVNFTGSYTTVVQGVQAEIGLSIMNLLNSGDITNQFFRLNNDILEIERIENRSLAFTPNVFLKLNF